MILSDSMIRVVVYVYVVSKKGCKNIIDSDDEY